MKTSFSALIVLLALGASVVSAGEGDKSPGAYKAPEIGKADLWINSGPLTLKGLKGKVILIDFWAFDCEPCIKSMPHVVDLHSRYGNSGLAVISIHTPRSSDEKDVSRLREAISRMGIAFPVAVDGKQKLWRDYQCDLWPSLFVIDRAGVVRYSRGGATHLDELDEAVVKLLKG